MGRDPAAVSRGEGSVASAAGSFIAPFPSSRAVQAGYAALHTRGLRSDDQPSMGSDSRLPSLSSTHRSMSQSRSARSRTAARGPKRVGPLGLAAEKPASSTPGSSGWLPSGYRTDTARRPTGHTARGWSCGVSPGGYRSRFHTTGVCPGAGAQSAGRIRPSPRSTRRVGGSRAGRRRPNRREAISHSDQADLYAASSLQRMKTVGGGPGRPAPHLAGQGGVTPRLWRTCRPWQGSPPTCQRRPCSSARLPCARARRACRRACPWPPAS